MRTEYIQIESRELENVPPPFFKKMLKGGTWVEGEISKFTFWYTVEYFTSNQSKSKFIVLHTCYCQLSKDMRWSLVHQKTNSHHQQPLLDYNKTNQYLKLLKHQLQNL